MLTTLLLADAVNKGGPGSGPQGGKSKLPKLPPRNKVITRAEIESMLAQGWSMRQATLYQTVGPNKNPMVRMVDFGRGIGQEPRVFSHPALSGNK